MSFEDQVRQYLNRPEMQAEIKAHYKKIGGSADGVEKALKYAEEAIQAIIDSLPESLKSGSTRPITTDDLVPGYPRLNSNGDYEVLIRWYSKAIQRDSLYNTEYPDGVKNIVALFSTGTRPSRNFVAGYWKRAGSMMYSYYRIPAGWSRAADPFLRDAIDKFNASHKEYGVILMAPDKYY